MHFSYKVYAIFLHRLLLIF